MQYHCHFHLEQHKIIPSSRQNSFARTSSYHIINTHTHMYILPILHIPTFMYTIEIVVVVLIVIQGTYIVNGMCGTFLLENDRIKR